MKQLNESRSIIYRLNEMLSKYNYEVHINKYEIVELLSTLDYFYDIRIWPSINSCLIGSYSIFNHAFMEKSLKSKMNAIKGSSLDEIHFNLDMLGV